MAKVKATVKLPSRTALRLGSAFAVSLSPMIAQDKQLDLTKVLAGVTAKNFKERRASIAKLARDGLEDMLTPEAAAAPAGAGPDDVIMRVLDMVDGQLQAAPAAELEADTLEPNAAAAPAAAAVAPKKGKEGVLELLKGKGMSEDDLAEVGGMFEPEAEDEELDENGNPKKKDDTAVDKKAMDQAIKLAQDQTADRMRTEFRELQEARDLVRPHVGDVAIAFDTSEKVLRAALGTLGVKGADTMHVDALRPVLANIPAKEKASPRIAADALPTERATELSSRFAHAANIRLQ